MTDDNPRVKAAIAAVTGALHGGRGLFTSADVLDAIVAGFRAYDAALHPAPVATPPRPPTLTYQCEPCGTMTISDATSMQCPTCREWMVRT